MSVQASTLDLQPSMVTTDAWRSRTLAVLLMVAIAGIFWVDSRYPALLKRYRAGTQKALLVEALGDALPPQIVAQSKRTFTLPWEDWLRGPLRARLARSFADPAPALAPHLHSEGVGNVWNTFLAGKTSWSRPWSLYVLNEWCRKHL